MKKTIADVEAELGWFADQPAHDGKAAALAGVAMLHAVRDFDNSSGRLAKRMLWLTVAIGVLTLIQIAIGLANLFKS
jgi:hypothetical protein